MQKKTYKPVIYSQSIWRRLFFLKKNRLLKYEERFIMARGSQVPASFLNIKLYIYDGINWVPRYVNKWMVGYAFGVFTWNRKIALYKAKQLKKKKNKWNLNTCYNYIGRRVI